MVQPNDTFHNLSAEKRHRFIRAAVREFADNGYRQASLNSLVRDLGIAKGSVYRYFADKEALYLYLFDDFVQQVKGAVKEAVGEGQGDFFARVEQVFLAGLGFIDRYPDYYRIYLRLLSENDTPRRDELLGRIRLFSEDFFLPLCQEAQGAGRIRADIPARLIIFMIDSLLDRFLQAYAGGCPDGGNRFSGMEDADLKNQVRQIIAALQTGVAR